MGRTQSLTGLQEEKNGKNRDNGKDRTARMGKAHFKIAGAGKGERSGPSAVLAPIATSISCHRLPVRIRYKNLRSRREYGCRKNTGISCFLWEMAAQALIMGFMG